MHTYELVKRFAKGSRVKVVTQLIDNRIDWLAATTIHCPEQLQRYEQDNAEIFVVKPNRFERLILSPFIKMYKYSAVIRIVVFLLLYNILKRKVLKIAHDCQLIHNIHTGFGCLHWVALKVAKKKRIPYICTPLLHTTERKGYLLSRLYSQLYREADALIAMTETEKASLIAQGAAAEKVFSVAIGPVLLTHSANNEFKVKYGIGKYMVLFVGQKFRTKGYLAMLQSTNLVWEGFPETYFVFVGPRYPESEAIFSRFTDKRIVELDTLNEIDKSNAFGACDIFCMPSLQESLGGVFLEAWMMEKPVIAGDIPCERELINQGLDGFLVKQQPQQIARRIIQLLGSSKLRKTMGKRGKEKVLSKYTWNRIAKDLEGIYQSLLKIQ